MDSPSIHLNLFPSLYSVYMTFAEALSTNLVVAEAYSPYGVFTPEQDNDKTNVEPVHSYDAFHTGRATTGVKGIIGIHKFNICLVVVLSLSCSGVKTP